MCVDYKVGNCKNLTVVYIKYLCYSHFIFKHKILQQRKT